MRAVVISQADADIVAFEDYLLAFLSRRSQDDVLSVQIAHHFCLNPPPAVAEAGYATRDPAGAGERTLFKRGKRLRPRLLLAAAGSLGAAASGCFPACAAIELLHNYSLIHDDIEDGDTLRHGRTTIWGAYGIAHGINAGDAVGALAQLALAPVAGCLGPEAAFAMAIELAGANYQMCEGQALDLAYEGGAGTNLDAYTSMIEGKTGALFACAASFGARCANADVATRKRCAEIGRLFGLAFQIQDDINGVWEPQERTGKPAGTDIARRKVTYPIAWAINYAGAGAARAIRELYGTSAGLLSAESVDRVRGVLDDAGARAAARAAADTYFESAAQLTAGMEPLTTYINIWR